jgi:hypothetical protein
MKKTGILFFVLFWLGLSSCDDAPNDKIEAVKTEFAGWKYDSTVKKPVQAFEDYVQIYPTWSQSINYASKSKGFWINTLGGLFFVILAIVLFVFKSTDSKLLPESVDKFAIYLIFVLLVAGSFFLYSKPGDVRWNNNKWVNKQHYDKVIKETGSTKPIWDSLENNCLIIGVSCK